MPENANLIDEISLLKDENSKLESQLTNMFNIMTLTSELTLTLNIDEVYRNILDILIVSIGSHRHSIALLDSAGVLRIVASKFGDDEVDFEHAILEKGIAKQVMESQEIFIADNIFSEKLDDVIACIPLIAEDKLIGLLLIHELLSHKKAFIDEDIELFNMISTQAGYAISAANAYELTKKEVEDKDKEITKLYDVSSLVNSAVDINEVLKITLDSVSDMIISDIVAIYLYSDENNKLLLRHSMGLDPYLIDTYKISLDEGITGKAFNEKRPILIKDLEHEVRYVDLVSTDEAKLYSGSVLAVPIMVKDRPIGVITVSKFKGGKCLDVPEKKILTTLAAQTAIGIDNAYLYEKQEKELVRVSSLFVATNQLHSTMDIDEIYKIANELLVDFIGASKFCMFLKDTTEENLNIVLSRGIDKEIADSISIPVGKGIIGKSISDGKSFIISPHENPPKIKLGNEDFNLFACIPLKLENKIVGAIVINELLAQKDNFGSFDKELFDLMAQNTATAILRAQLFAKAEQKSSSLYDLSRLLTIEYDVKSSINTALRLIHNNIKDIKSVVMLYEGTDKSEYNILAYKGFTKKELEHFKPADGKNSVRIKLYYQETELGELYITTNKRKEFNTKELAVFNLAGSILSEFVYHDKNFKLSKNLAIMLNKEKSQSDAIVKGVADGLIVTDLKQCIMLINPIIEKIFNIKENKVIGATFETVIKHEGIQNILYKTIKSGNYKEDVRLDKKNGYTALSIRSSLVKDEKGKPIGVVTIMHDITKEKEADDVKNEFLKKLKKISITDPLTDLYNRRYFEKHLNEEFLRSKRYNSGFSCIMIDADHFKNINDTYGHDMGDEVLVCLSKNIKQSIRSVDIAARYGGEEFILILPETPSKNSLIVAERIRTSLEKEKFSAKGVEFSVTISIGISTFPGFGLNQATDLVKQADEALYKAKNSGRNRCVVFEYEEQTI